MKNVHRPILGLVRRQKSRGGRDAKISGGVSPTVGGAPIKVQHLSGCEIGVNVKYLANPFGIKYKLNGFELGVAHPFQIR